MSARLSRQERATKGCARGHVTPRVTSKIPSIQNTVATSTRRRRPFITNINCDYGAHNVKRPTVLVSAPDCFTRRFEGGERVPASEGPHTQVRRGSKLN